MNWDEFAGEGLVYLIQPPDCRVPDPKHPQNMKAKNVNPDSDVFKIGETYALKNRLNLYITNLKGYVRHYGVDVLAIAYVKNKYQGEELLKKSFDAHKFLPVKHGRNTTEYRRVFAPKGKSIREAAIHAFLDAVDNSELTGDVYVFPNSSDKSIYRYKKSRDLLGIKDCFRYPEFWY